MIPVARIIAIVDDDPSILRAVRRLLRAAGYTVKTFGSGDELLGSAELAAIDCLLVDIHLAGPSGFEVQEQLASVRPSIPVVFMTAHDDATTRERALRAANAQYLRKPFEERALLAAIQTALADS